MGLELPNVQLVVTNEKDEPGEEQNKKGDKK
jgi:hypothetical protein